MKLKDRSHQKSHHGHRDLLNQVKQCTWTLDPSRCCIDRSLVFRGVKRLHHPVGVNGGLGRDGQGALTGMWRRQAPLE